MEINELIIYFISFVMCVVVGCIPLFVRQEPEMSNEDHKCFLGSCVVVGILPIFNFIFGFGILLIMFLYAFYKMVRDIRESIKQNFQE